MSRYLTVFFSAGGTTARAARAVAGAVDAGLFEIRPAVSYTAADLNWNNPASRTSVEMNDEACRPELASAEVPDLTEYDAVFVGFPIWWYVAPTIVNTFLEQYDLTGKTVVPFATSGGSGMGRTNAGLAPSCKGANLKEGKRFAANATETELAAWASKF